MTTYSTEGNTVFRDNSPLAEIQPDGSLHYLDDDFKRFAIPITKHLEEVGRYNRELGLALYILPEQKQEVPPPPAVPVEKRKLSTVRELVREMAAFIEEPPPAMSPLFGDETPEIWTWIRNHADVLDSIRLAFEFTGPLGKRKDVC